MAAKWIIYLTLLGVWSCIVGWLAWVAFSIGNDDTGGGITFSLLFWGGVGR